MDQDHTARLARAGSHALRLAATSARWAASDRPHDLVEALDHGRALVGARRSRAGFARDLADGARPRAARSSTAPTRTPRPWPSGYAERIVQAWALARSGLGAAAPLELRERAWFNPELVSRDYNVPAVIGAIMLILSLLLTSLAVVREREIGTLEQLMVSPLGRARADRRQDHALRHHRPRGPGADRRGRAALVPRALRGQLPAAARWPACSTCSPRSGSACSSRPSRTPSRRRS